MTTITPDRTLAEVVNADPAATRVFESFALDYCCGGRRRIDEACATAGVAVAAVLDALEDLGPAPEVDWATMGPAELVDHLEATHHAYLHAEFGRLTDLTEKVVAAHGTRHPELAEVAAAYGALRADLEPHLMKEEQVLFPMILGGRGRSAAMPIHVMEEEHEDHGRNLERLRELTHQFTPPEEACGTWRALYLGLHELDEQLMQHIHLENNVLFPRALRS